MKKISLSATFLIAFIQFSLAQYVPEGFNYQAVVRNTNGDLVTNTQVAIEIVLKEGSSGGTAIFAEKHTKTTNAQGIVQLILGQGNVTQGNFSTIDWASAAKYISIAVDVDGNNVFTDLGSTQLLSVPYALYAKNSGSGGSGTTYNAGAGININGTTISATDASTTNELQTLSIAGDQISISNGNTITLPPNSGTDAQTLSLSGTQLTISNGNTVTLPTGTTYSAGSGINIAGNTISAADNSATNEIQSLTLVGSQLAISGSNAVNLPTGTTYSAGSGINIAGNTISASDNSATNEIQSLTLVGSQLAISGSNAVNLPTGTTYSAGSGINIAGNTISATDNSITNEIQQLSLNGNTLSLNNGGGTVTLPAGGSSYWESFGGNDISNNNGGTVFVGPATYQSLWVSGDNSSAALVAQGSGSGEAIFAQASGTGKAIIATGNINDYLVEFTNPGGIGLRVEGNYGGITGINTGPVGGYGVFGESLIPFGTGGSFRNELGGVGLEVIGAFEILTPTSPGSGIFNSSTIQGVAGQSALEIWSDWRPAAPNDGFYKLGASNARWSTVYAVNGTINTSDARQKQAVQPLSYGIQQVMALNPVSYEWIRHPEQGRKIGFLAQDLQKIIPEVVADKEWSMGEDGNMTSQPAAALGVYYSDLIPVLTKAIQEQQTMIDLLKQQNEALLKRVEVLEKQ